MFLSRILHSSFSVPEKSKVVTRDHCKLEWHSRSTAASIVRVDTSVSLTPNRAVLRPHPNTDTGGACSQANWTRLQRTRVVRLCFSTTTLCVLCNRTSPRSMLWATHHDRIARCPAVAGQYRALCRFLGQGLSLSFLCSSSHCLPFWPQSTNSLQDVIIIPHSAKLLVMAMMRYVDEP